MKNINMLYAELFAGVGGFGVGITNAVPNAKCLFFSENDKFAIQTYLKNNPTHTGLGDCTKIDYSAYKHVELDLLAGGVPCQSWSRAGKRKGFADKRGMMWHEFARALKELQPRYFIAENVKGLVCHKKGESLKQIIKELEDCGYNVKHEVLRASNFGVPQDRDRLFIVGIRKDIKQEFEFSVGSPTDLCVGDMLQDNVDSKYHLSDKSTQTLHREIAKGRTPQIHSNDNPQRYSPTIGTQAHNCRGIHVDPKYTISDEGWAGAQRHKKEQQKKGRGFGFVLMDKKTKRSPTITSHYSRGGSEILVKQKRKNPRKLTPVEGERFQGFSDNWTAGVSDTQRYLQIGNAVPPPMVESIARVLLIDKQN